MKQKTDFGEWLKKFRRNDVRKFYIGASVGIEQAGFSILSDRELGNLLYGFGTDRGLDDMFEEEIKIFLSNWKKKLGVK